MPVCNCEDQWAIAYNTKEQETNEIREMFSLFDTNHDGRITSEELGIVLERLGYIISSESLKALVDEMDYDGSGTIELTEFVRIIEARKETVNIEEAMIEAFRVFDQDQNGFIERRELKNVMKSLGNNLNDKDIDRMMKDADKNGDGRIDFQDRESRWKMADTQQTKTALRIRKLRKKLRQIENLKRVCGQRELAEEEINKINQSDDIREKLQELISVALEDDQEMETKQQEEQLTIAEQNGDCDDNVSKEKKEAQEEDELVLKLEENPDTEESETIKEVLKKDDEAMQVEANETDEVKIIKSKKGKGVMKNPSNPKECKQVQFSVELVEGHHHPICGIDFDKKAIISGGHDTSFKIWNKETYEELSSLGGHTGSISSVVLISEDRAATGSQDCSIKTWDVKKGEELSSVYVFNPVTCLAHQNELLAIGNEGGKIDIYDIVKGEITISHKAHDDALVAIVFMDDSRLASASADGIVKVFELHDSELVNVIDTYDDISTVKSFKKDENAADTPNTSILNLPLRKISCIAAFDDTVFWGDDGFNVKAFNTKTGEIVKLRNNLNEFSPTDAMTVLKDGDDGFLLCAGFDIDNGTGYINVRKLPSMDYIGTISDDDLGHINCMAASMKDGKIQMITGGSELRVWNQVAANNGKKRPASDEIDEVIPCKFIRSYNVSRDSEEDDSEPEAEEEEENVTQLEDEKKASKSWCVVQ
eukprot:gene7187-12857_t